MDDKKLYIKLLGGRENAAALIDRTVAPRPLVFGKRKAIFGDPSNGYRLVEDWETLFLAHLFSYNSQYSSLGCNRLRDAICKAVVLRHTTPNAAFKKVVEAIHLDIINAGFILQYDSTNECEIVLENGELVTVDKRPSSIDGEMQLQPRVVHDGIAEDGSSNIDMEKHSRGDAAVTSSLHGRTIATPEPGGHTFSTSAIKRKRAATSPVEHPKLLENASETSKRFLAMLEDGRLKEATVLIAADNTVADTAVIEQAGHGEAVFDAQAPVRRRRAINDARAMRAEKDR